MSRPLRLVQAGEVEPVVPVLEFVDDFPGGQYGTGGVSFLLEHLDWMRRRGLSDRTLWVRRVSMVMLAEFIRADPAIATYAQLDAWQRSLSTVKMQRWRTAVITPYYKYLHVRGYRPDNPAALLPRARQPRGLPRPIAEERLSAAVAAAPPRILPWLLLAGWSGLRAIEIARLTREAFGADGGGAVWVRVVGKGQHIRDVRVPGWCWERIEPGLPASGPCWPRLRGDGPTSAKLVSQLSNRYLRQCGFEDTLHALRHRVATEILQATGDVRLVQDVLGHADLATLSVYTRVRPGAMSSAIDALPRPPGW